MAGLISKADSDAKDARRWKKELQLASKREKTWRERSERIVERYRGEEKKKNRFNVLWSNTEILRPAYYNSKPSPDVRRRFRDADPVGKAVSEVLERSLIVVTDGSSTDASLKNDVLDGLLCGRGVSRVRYVPKLTQVPSKPAKEEGEPDGQTSESEEEEIEFEQALIEHVDWRDFRHGYGRVWDEVPWEGFRHKLTWLDAEKKFKKADLAGVKFAQPTTDDPKKPGEEVNETQKVAEFWEIWDKLGERVFFLQEDIEHLLYPKDNLAGDPPLAFEGFFPTPEPLRLVENTGSLLPIPPFDLYENQANELDKLSMRIDRIVSTLRLRGIYDAKLTELQDLTTADDNELTPVQNAQAWADKGLDAAISWMPVEQNATVLTALYDARTRQKAIIDELIGIADIIRGATDPDETFGAQELKQSNASVRLLRPRQEVQRYARDLLRLAAEVMAQKFAPETFADMTDLTFPTAQQKAMLQMQIQQAAQMPPGQPPPPGTPPPPDPSLLQVPTWDDIMGLMRSSGMRKFKVDVETDSTVAGTIQSDMKGLTEVLTAISQTLQGLAPIVAQGALPVDAAKEVVLAVIRRARLGMAVEDAFDKLQAPKPQAQPNPKLMEIEAQSKADQQLEQMKSGIEVEKFKVEEQTRAQLAAAKEQLEHERVMADGQMKLQLDAAEKAHREQLETIRAQAETARQASALETQRMIADADNQTKLMIAELTAKHAKEMQGEKLEHDQSMVKLKASLAPPPVEETEEEEAPTAAQYSPVEHDLVPLMAQMVNHMAKPKRVIRDENGKISGVE